MAEMISSQELREFAAWKRQKDEWSRKRGRYWLTPEGREELRDAFGYDDDDGSGASVAVLLNEVERLEAELAANAARVADFGLAKGLTYAEVRRAIVESRGG